MILDLTRENIDKADGPTLDAMVAVHVMGWDKNDDVFHNGEQWIACFPDEPEDWFCPHSDPRDWWRVVEKMREMGSLVEIMVCNGGFVVRIAENAFAQGDVARETNIGIAVCRAALRAVLAWKEGGK